MLSRCAADLREHACAAVYYHATWRAVSHERRSQVIVPGQVLQPWLAEGGAAPAEGGDGAPDAADGGVLKLFSLNDYLGLSTHPAVCQAAADAALLFVSGAPARAAW